MAEKSSPSKGHRPSPLLSDAQAAQLRSYSSSPVQDGQSRGRPLTTRDIQLPLRSSRLVPASVNPPKIPNTVLAAPPHFNFEHVHQISARRTMSATTALSSADRLHPLTPIHTNNRPSALFTTSPANSEPSSPGLRPSNIRSSSSGSLNRFQAQARGPPTPTTKPSRRGRNRYETSFGGSPRSRKSAESLSRPGTPHPHGKPSVKHLTCFWWKEKGDCRFKEEDCLYAHRDTGIYADAPRQVAAGEPAMAGRNLDRATRKFHGDHHNKSSSSLKSVASNTEIFHAAASRPGTPASTELPVSPAIHEQLEETEKEMAVVRSDNVFLRSLVEQDRKEKAVLLTTIDNLQAENKGKSTPKSLTKFRALIHLTALVGNHTNLQAEKTQLTNDRNGLRETVNQFQNERRQTAFTNPFGAIGSAFSRDVTQRRSASGPGTGPPVEDAELRRQNSNLKEMLRNYGLSP